MSKGKKPTNTERITNLESDISEIKNSFADLKEFLTNTIAQPKEEAQEEEEESIVDTWKPDTIRERIEGLTTTEFAKHIKELEKNGAEEETIERFREVFREIVDERISGKAVVKETKGKKKSKKAKVQKPKWKNEHEYVNYVLKNAETIYANKKAGLNQIFPSGKQFTEIESNTIAYFVFRDILKPLIEKRDFKALQKIKIPLQFKGKKATYDTLELAPSLKGSKYLES